MGIEPMSIHLRSACSANGAKEALGTESVLRGTASPKIAHWSDPGAATY